MIYAEYRTSSVWDLDNICQQLDIARDAVVDYYVKWDALFLTYRDADGNECEEEFEPNMFSASDNFDWKRPENVTEETA